MSENRLKRVLKNMNENCGTEQINLYINTHKLPVNRQLVYQIDTNISKVFVGIFMHS